MAREASGDLACGRNPELRARCEHKEVHGRTTHVRIQLALCCSNAASILCRVARCMALLALSQAEQGPGQNKSRVADPMVCVTRSEVRAACQGEGAAARQGAGDDGWHSLQRCGRFFRVIRN